MLAPMRWMPVMVWLGCAKSHAVRAEMTAPAHEAEAAAHDAAAATHDAAYDPAAEALREHCRMSRSAKVCWTSEYNPTAEHLRLAEQERRLAADHRAASATLAAAEAEKCVLVDAVDRDASPFRHVEDLVRVTPLANSSGEVAGATIVFRPVAGLTVESLQAIVDCHLARNAAVGNAMPEMPDCPLVPAGVEATVTATDDGIAVAVRADDRATSADILERARRLLATRPAGSL